MKKKPVSGMVVKRTMLPLALCALVLLGTTGCTRVVVGENGRGQLVRDGRARAFWSFVLPGAGQIRNGEHGTAALLLTLELLNHVSYWRVDEEEEERNDERYYSVATLLRLWGATDAYSVANTLNETKPFQLEGLPTFGAGACAPEDARVGPRATPLLAFDPLSRRLTTGVVLRF